MIALMLALAGSTPAVAADDDGDGYAAEEGDCDDANPEVHPFATERCGNGIDDNCNAIVDETHSWSLQGYFFIGAEASWVSAYGHPMYAPDADELKHTIGFREVDVLYLNARPADCVDSLAIEILGGSASCTADDGAFTYPLTYEVRCGWHDTGLVVLQTSALDSTGGMVGFDTLVLEARDVVPETLWLSVDELHVGREGCLDAYFDNNEEIVFEVVDAPGEPRTIIEGNGDVVACFTPERRGEAEIVVRGEDGEGNVLEARRTVFVRGCATGGGVVSGSVAALAALLLLMRRGPT